MDWLWFGLAVGETLRYVKVTIGTESQKGKSKQGPNQPGAGVTFNQMLKIFGNKGDGLGTATDIYVQVKIDGTFSSTTKCDYQFNLLPPPLTPKAATADRCHIPNDRVANHTLCMILRRSVRPSVRPSVDPCTHSSVCGPRFIGVLPITRLRNNEEMKLWVDLTDPNGAHVNTRVALALKLTGAQMVEETALDGQSVRVRSPSRRRSSARRKSVVDLPTAAAPDQLSDAEGGEQAMDGFVVVGGAGEAGDEPGDGDGDGGEGKAKERVETAEQKAAREEAERKEAERQALIVSYEPKAGEYQVQVHIIEVRGLKAEDAEGTSELSARSPPVVLHSSLCLPLPRSPSDRSPPCRP